MMTKWLRTGRSVMIVAATWNVFDVVLHVVINEIDLLRMAGNAVVLAATALTYRPGVSGAMVATVAAALVVAFNVAFFVDRGEVPPAAFILVAVCLVLLAMAVRRFRAEDAGVADGGPDA